MATKRGQPPHIISPGPLFLSQWMLKKGVSDEALAQAIRVTRQTIWKWQRYPTRMNPLKQVQVAAVLGIWPPQLWVLPDSREDRLMQAMAPEPAPRKPPETLPKIPGKPLQN